MDHPDAVLKLMKALTGDNRFEESLNEFSEQERKGITMCELLDKIEARGEALGEALGIEKGIIIFIEDKLEDNIPDDKIIEKLRNKFDLTTEKAEEYCQHPKIVSQLIIVDFYAICSCETIFLSLIAHYHKLSKYTSK